jgi:hypothetical protein
VGSPVRTLGALRLVTTRSKLDACEGLPPSLSAPTLYGVDCFPPTDYSAAPLWNTTVPADVNTWRAFTQPPVYEPGSAVPQFVYIVPSDLANAQCAARVASLAGAGWLDAASRDARAQAVLLAGAAGRVATVDFSAVFTRGSLVETAVVVQSAPVAPYAGGAAGGLFAACDAVFLLYLGYLAWRTARRLARPCGRGAGAAACVAEAAGSFWRLLDVATVAAMAATAGLWVALLVQLAALRDAAAQQPPPSRALFSQPPALRAPAAAATATFCAWKQAAVAALVCLTLRLYKYFAFQPRLGVMSAVFSRAAGDACTHGSVFAVLVVLFAVWAAVLYAPQDAGWVAGGGSVLTLFQYMMYDYDYAAQAQQYPLLAAVFYVAFMLLITNLILWMFLAILFEEYSAVRVSSHELPSVADEAAAALAAARARLACPRAAASCARRRGAPPPPPPHPAAEAAAVPFASVAAALRGDAALAAGGADAAVDPADLARALRISAAAALCLLAEAAAAADAVMATLPAADDDGDDGGGGGGGGGGATMAAADAIEARAAVLRAARARGLYGAADSAAPGARALLAEPVPQQPRSAAPEPAPAAAKPPPPPPPPPPPMGRATTRAALRFADRSLGAALARAADDAGDRDARAARLLASVDALRASAAALAAALGVPPPPPPPPPPLPPGVVRPAPGAVLKVAWPPLPPQQE